MKPDLLSLLEAKRAEVRAKHAEHKALLTEVRALEAKLKQVKQEEAAAKKAAEKEKAVQKFSGLWLEVFESGLNERQVISLQNLDTKLRVIGEMFGVSISRARQLREEATRKMLHYPTRHDLARKLGLSVKLRIDAPH